MHQATLKPAPETRGHGRVPLSQKQRWALSVVFATCSVCLDQRRWIRLCPTLTGILLSQALSTHLPSPRIPLVHLFNTYLVYFLLRLLAFSSSLHVSQKISCFCGNTSSSGSSAFGLAPVSCKSLAGTCSTPDPLSHPPPGFVGDSPPILNINLHSITRKRNQLKEQKWLGCLKSQHKKRSPAS